MDKKRLAPLLIAVIGVLVIAFVYFLTSQKPKADILRSEDGHLALSIPKGALPEGVAVGDISIQKTDASGILEELGVDSLPDEMEPTAMLAYRLLPDGLTLERPISVTLTGTTGPDGVIPALFHWSDGDYELLANTAVLIDLDTGQTSVSGKISHFSVVGSNFYGKKSGLFNYELTSGGKGKVGDSFPYILTITPNQEFEWFFHHPHFDDHRDYYYRMAPGTSWEVHSFAVMTRHDGVIEPMAVISPSSRQGGFDSFQLEDEHTCVEEGTNTLFMPRPNDFIKIDYRQELEVWLRGGVPEIRYRDASVELQIQGGYFECDDDKIAEWEYMGEWDYDYVTLAAMSEEEFAELGSPIRVPAIAEHVNGRDLIFPFHDQQFDRYPAHSGIEETGGDAYCASEHYHAEFGRSIEDPEEKVPEPYDEYGAHCGWRAIEGSLTADLTSIRAWMEAYAVDHAEMWAELVQGEDDDFLVPEVPWFPDQPADVDDEDDFLVPEVPWFPEKESEIDDTLVPEEPWFPEKESEIDDTLIPEEPWFPEE